MAMRAGHHRALESKGEKRREGRERREKPYYTM